MKSRTIWRCGALPLALFLLGGVGLGQTSVAGEDEPAPRVLILNSYHRGFFWTDELEQAAEEVLYARWPRTEVYNEYLDVKRFRNEEIFARFLDVLRDKYPDGSLDLILVSDDSAYQFILEARRVWQRQTPVVFCGVNDLDPVELARHRQITGVEQDVEYMKSIELIARLQEGVRRVAIISDNTLTGRAYQKGFAACFPNPWQIQPLWLDGTHLNEQQLMERLQRLEPDTAVILSLWWHDSTGRYRPPEESVRRLAAVSPVPIYAVLPSDVRHGAIGGYVQSGASQGRRAAEMAVQILEGTASADEIPVELHGSGQYLFSRASLRRHGISEHLLPPGAEFFVPGSLELTPQEREWLASHKTIRVLVADRPPLEMRASPPSGVAVEYLRRLTADTGLTIEWDITAASRAEAMERLRSGQADLILAMASTPQREAVLSFTRPYLSMQWVVFTRGDSRRFASLGNLSGKTVVVEEGYLIQERLREQYPAIRLLPARSPAEALQHLASGRADAYVGDLAVGTYVARREGFANVVVAGPTPFGQHDIAMAVRPDLPHLTAILDRAIAASEPEVLEDIRREFQESVPYEYGFTTEQVMRYVLTAVSVFTVALAAALGWALFNIRQRRRVEASLRESEQRMLSAIDAANLGTWEWFPDSGRVVHDANWRRLFQVPIASDGRLPLDHWKEIVHPADMERVLGALRNVRDGGSDTLLEEFRQMHPQKGWIWVALAGRVVQRDPRGRAVRLVGIQMDIDDRKNSELVLEESRAALEEAQAIARVGSWSYDVARDIFAGSREAMRILYNDPEAVVAGLEDLLQAVHADDSVDTRDAIARALESKSPLSIEFRTAGPRETKYVHVRAELVAGSERVSHLIGIIQDITERKLAELALRESEARLAEAQAIAHIGHWHIDLRHDLLEWSDEVKRIWGLGPDAADANYEAFIAGVHPDDRDRVNQAFWDFVNKGAIYDSTWRVLSRDGQLKYVHAKGTRVENEEGVAVGAFGTIQDVTARVVGEEEIRRREEYLRITLNSIGDAVMTTSADGRVVRVNPVAERLIGWSQEEATGRPLDEVFRIINAFTRQVVEAPVARVLETGQIVGLANHTVLLSRDGNEYQVADSAAPIRDESGRVLGVVLVFRDVTFEYEQERRLRESEERYRLTLNVVRDGVWDTNFKTDTTIRSDHCYTMLGYAPSDFGGPSAWQALIHPDDQPAFAERLSRSLERDEPFEFEYRMRHKDGSWRWILSRGQVIERDPAGGPVRMLGSHTDITHRRTAEEALRRSRALLELSQTVAHLGHWRYSHESNDLQCSDELLRLLELDRDSLDDVRSQFLARLAASDRQRLLEAVDQMLADPTVFEGQWDLRIVLPSGRARHMRMKTILERRTEGTVVEAYGTIQDVTDFVLARQKIQEQEENLRITLNSIGDAVIATDLEGRVTRMNPIAERLTGWTMQQASGQLLTDVFRIVNAMSRRTVDNPVDKVLQEGTIVGLANHTVLIARDGTEYQIADSAAPIRDADGTMRGVVLVFRDVTEEYLRDEMLRESEERHRMVVDAVRDGIWDWNIVDDMAVCSDRWYEILGYTPQEFLANEEAARKSLVHPDDLETWNAVRHCVESGELYEVEVRMRTKSGDWRWVQSRGRVVERDSEGRALRMVGTTTDIHEKKVAQLLAERQSEMHRALYQGMAEGCIYCEPILDENGRFISYRFIDTNPAFERLTGATRESVIGRDIREVWPDTEAEWFQHHARLMETGEPNCFEAYHAPTGHYYFSNVFKPEHDKSYFCISILDITSRVHAERELARINAELQRHTTQLEQMVAARTAEIIEKNVSLQKTLDELRSTQSQLVQSEKMAVLGHLIAGVAHEINTPLGAINSAGGMIEILFEKLMERLHEFVDWTRGDVGPVVKSLLAAAPRSGEATLSSRERRALRDRLVEQLRSKDVHHARELASLLIDLDLADGYEQYAPLFAHPDSVRILETIRDISNIHRGTSIIHLATQKAAKTVFALKSYAHRNPMGRMEAVNLAQSIDTVLMLYHSKIKHDVELYREFNEVPRVECHPDQVSQIWTNLIHNALQAMEYRGKLTIRLFEAEGHAVVSISDTGCGIDDSIRHRIFEPFFTTKAAGEGSGLGLDIVKNIVLRHGGAIDFDSAVGRGATFTVRLPIHQPVSPETGGPADGSPTV